MLDTSLTTLTSLLPLLLLLTCAATAAGLIAGFLGVGGGIIIVPALFFALSYTNISENIHMHMAIGTSLGTMIFTSLRSLSAHHKHSAVDINTLKSWILPVIIGASTGGLVSKYLNAAALTAIFGCIALIIATYLLLQGEAKSRRSSLPPEPLNKIIAAIIGLLSALMGIGGGTFSITYLTICGKPIHRAIGTSSGLGALISIPGTLGFIIAGWNANGLPIASLGYVNVIGCLLLVPVTALVAPLGAAMVHRVDRRLLTRIFALFLMIISIRMLATLWIE